MHNIQETSSTQEFEGPLSMDTLPRTVENTSQKQSVTTTDSLTHIDTKTSKYHNTVDVNATLSRCFTLLNDKKYKDAFVLVKDLDENYIAYGSYLMSIMYHNGDHVTQDFYQEVFYLKRAVKAGHKSAIFNLALALGTGKGIKQNIHRSIKMMTQLAQQGYEPAVEFMAEV